MNFGRYLFIEMAMQSVYGLALYEMPGMIGLYKPSAMRRYLISGGNENKLGDSIIGVMEYRDNTMYNVREVDQVSAVHGYGPSLYYIAMQTSPNGLAPTRTGQVSADAKGVWRAFYDGVGANDVMKVPLEGTDIDDDNILATHYPNDDYLDMRYSLKIPKIDLAPLRQQNQIILRNDPYGEKNDLLAEALDTYLRSAMNAIYA